AKAGHFHPEPGDERAQRDEDAEQPGIALAVAPGSRVQLDVVVVVIVVMVMPMISMRLHFCLLVKREIEVCVLDKATMFVKYSYIGKSFDGPRRSFAESGPLWRPQVSKRPGGSYGVRGRSSAELDLEEHDRVHDEQDRDRDGDAVEVALDHRAAAEATA